MIAELLARHVTRLVRRNPFAAEPRFAQLDVQPHLFVELGLRPAAADEQAKPPEDLSDSRHRYFSGLSMVTLFAARARSRRRCGGTDRARGPAAGGRPASAASTGRGDSPPWCPTRLRPSPRRASAAARPTTTPPRPT